MKNHQKQFNFNTIFTLRNIIRYFLIPYIIFNVFTLSVFPLPWYDEVFMADVMQSLAEIGKYNANENGKSTEILIYGPLYFNLQVLITNSIGFDCFQFRLLSFISGILIIFMGIKILQYLQVSEKYQSLYILLISLQEIFFRGLHLGRMDLTATLPIIISLYLYIKYQESRIISQLLISRIAIMVLLSCAFLTTPRIVFILLPFGILFSIDFYRNTKNYFYHSLNIIIVLGVAISYLVWIFYKCSSIDNFLQLTYKVPIAQEHIMGFARLKRFGIQSYLYILPSIISFFLSLVIVWSLVQKKNLISWQFCQLHIYVNSCIFSNCCRTSTLYSYAFSLCLLGGCLCIILVKCT